MLYNIYYTPEIQSQFWELDAMHKFNETEIRLFKHLIETWQNLGLREMFWHSNAQMCLGGNCSLNTMKKARKRLCAAGLLDFTEGGKKYGEKSYYQLHVSADARKSNLIQTLLSEPEELSESSVNEHGLVVVDQFQGLTLLHTKNAPMPNLGVNDAPAQRCHLTPIVSNIDTLNSSSHLEKKEEKKEDSFSFFEFSNKTASQTTLFNTPTRTIKPSDEEIYKHVLALVQTDMGRDFLLPIDREIAADIALKFKAAREIDDWRNIKSQCCMIDQWKDWAGRYFTSAKDDTRAKKLKLEAEKNRLAAQERAERERTEYIARRQAEQADELAQKQHQAAQRVEFDTLIQTKILEKIMTNELQITAHHGNSHKNRTAKTSKHSAAYQNRNGSTGGTGEEESLEQYWERTRGAGASAEAA